MTWLFKLGLKFDKNKRLINGEWENDTTLFDQRLWEQNFDGPTFQDRVGRQELEIVIGDEHISFTTSKIGSLVTSKIVLLKIGDTSFTSEIFIEGRVTRRDSEKNIHPMSGKVAKKYLNYSQLIMLFKCSGKK
jgi:hypothetical protein